MAIIFNRDSNVRLVDFIDNTKGINVSGVQTITYDGNIVYENEYTEDGWDKAAVEASLQYLIYTEDDNYVYVTGFNSTIPSNTIYIPSIINGKRVVLKETVDD